MKATLLAKSSMKATLLAKPSRTESLEGHTAGEVECGRVLEGHAADKVEHARGDLRVGDHPTSPLRTSPYPREALLVDDIAVQ